MSYEHDTGSAPRPGPRPPHPVPADPAGRGESAPAQASPGAEADRQDARAGSDGGDADPRSFGDARIDAAMARLEASGERTTGEQVAEYEAVHRVLQDTLATIDEA